MLGVQNVGLAKVQTYLQITYQLTVGSNGIMTPETRFYRTPSTGYFKISTFNTGMTSDDSKVVKLLPIFYNYNPYVIAIKELDLESLTNSYNFDILGVDLLTSYQSVQT